MQGVGSAKHTIFKKICIWSFIENLEWLILNLDNVCYSGYTKGYFEPMLCHFVVHIPETFCIIIYEMKFSCKALKSNFSRVSQFCLCSKSINKFWRYTKPEPGVDMGDICWEIIFAQEGYFIRN